MHRYIYGVADVAAPLGAIQNERPGHGEDARLAVAERAKEAGALRADFVPEDLVLLLMANAGVVQGAGQAAPDAWRRFVALMLESFRADRASPLPPPPTPRQVVRAMRGISRTTDQQGDTQ